MSPPIIALRKSNAAQIAPVTDGDNAPVAPGADAVAALLLPEITICCR